MRRTIADRLGESYREAVHVTEHREVDAEELLAAVDAAEVALDVDISLVDVLVRVFRNAGRAPSVQRDVRRQCPPDLRPTARLSRRRRGGGPNCARTQGCWDIVARRDRTERQELTERALSDAYTMDDLQGGTFTVTNLGVLGVESFDPIINPPQIAILGVNTLIEKPVRGPDDDVAFRQHLPLISPFDHRIVDGRTPRGSLERWLTT